MQKQRNLWAFLAAFACTLWGISGLFAKTLFNTSRLVTPIWLSQVRMLTAGTVLLIVAGLRHHHPLQAIKNWHNLLGFVAYGLFGLLPVQFFYFTVVQKANASVATVLQFVGPFFVLAYMTITHQQVLRRIDLLAACTAFLGVVLLATHGNFHRLAITPQVLGLGMLAAVGVATNTLIPVSLLKRNVSLLVTGWGLIFAGLALVVAHPVWPAIPNRPIIWVATIAVIVIGTIIPFQVMTNSLHFIKPSTASLLDAFEPLSATVGSVLVFGLVMRPLDWVGSVLVVVAAMALNISPHKKSKLRRH